MVQPVFHLPFRSLIQSIQPQFGYNNGKSLLLRVHKTSYFIVEDSWIYQA